MLGSPLRPLPDGRETRTTWRVKCDLNLLVEQKVQSWNSVLLIFSEDALEIPIPR